MELWYNLLVNKEKDETKDLEKEELIQKLGLPKNATDREIQLKFWALEAGIPEETDFTRIAAVCIDKCI